jgi:hypothetical protein
MFTKATISYALYLKEKLEEIEYDINTRILEVIWEINRANIMDRLVDWDNSFKYTHEYFVARGKYTGEDVCIPINTLFSNDILQEWLNAQK